jgi:hypothetical protein
VIIGVAVTGAPAYADFEPGGRGVSPPSAQVVLGPPGGEVGEFITGFTGPADFNPVTSGYPPIAPNPPSAEWAPFEPGLLVFAGTFPGTTQAGQIVDMYCVDLEVDTEDGLGYNAQPWSVTNIPNIGFINRIIQTYYPQSTLPAGATSDEQRAAAVQAAIWFFSDRFLVSTATTTGLALYPLVSGIVSATLAAGPLNTEPPFPQVSVTGPDTGTAATIIGPYTVRTTASEATITVTGAQAFRDAAGRQPLPTTFTLPPGGTFFLRTASPASVTIHASAVAIAFPGATAAFVPADPDNPDPAQAQKLIFAGEAALNVESTRTITTRAAAPGGGAGGPTLPATGTEPAPIILLGLLLTSIGAIVTYAGGNRRFRRSRTSLS